MNTAKRYRLSVVMIVKNEADNLKVSLPAIADWVDEIIILDSGSTDDGQKLPKVMGQNGMLIPIGKALAGSDSLPKLMPQATGFWHWTLMKW